MLTLFDLNGFKKYNDAFGHPAGDALLVRLGARLAHAVHGHGRAYRLGGDEFCVIADAARAGLELAAPAWPRSPSTARASRYHPHGVGRPVEVTDATEALRKADRRMYAEKATRRVGRPPVARRAAARAVRAPTRPARSTSTARPSWRLASAASWAWTARRSTMLRPPPSCTTWARSPSRTRSSQGQRARRDRVGLHAPPHDHRRAHPLRRPGARPRWRSSSATTSAWTGAATPTACAGDEIRWRARDRRLRRLRRDDLQPPLPRPHRTTGQALAELRRCAGTQFDPPWSRPSPEVLEREMTAAARMPRECGL